MTTDITELAQSLKAAAEKATPGNWRAFKYHDGRCGVGGGHHDEIMVCEHISKRRPHDAEFIAMANPVNVLALVEALEKAQRYAKERDAENQDLMLTVGRLRVEREELESRAVKLPKFKMLEDYLAEVAIEERKQILVGVKLEFHRALSDAGVKVEAE
ncbi:ead/Ea22-like family protein [Klebsiella pneumoniae]|uniref:ead/Ea22-like family protein n=1 Tax=Klebsiella pneumoniae TaxID=573 RepID=UPI0011C0031F|nr:ead/Ea22-like family protein [Klebsiella pneumoniae]QEA09496.1 ead/Ea22-like family protein [Klebsiella phage ST13-OXA48phi12.5]